MVGGALGSSYRGLIGDLNFKQELNELISLLAGEFDARRWMDAVRRFLVLVFWYPREMKSLASVHQANTILITSMVDERYPRVLRRLCCALLTNLLVSEPQLIQKNLTQASDDPSTLDLLGRVIFCIGSRDALEPNVGNFVQWAVSPKGGLLRSLGLSGLLVASAYSHDLFSPAHLAHMDRHVSETLLSTSAAVAVSSGGSKLLNTLLPSSSSSSSVHSSATAASSHAASSLSMLLEPDGSPARDFFTVLNESAELSEDQHHHVELFSFLLSWMELQISAPTADPATMTKTVEAILSYVQRVVDQVRYRSVVSSEGGSGRSRRARLPAAYLDMVVAECVRLLDAVSTFDRSRTARAFALVKRLQDQAERSDAYLTLRVLQFYTRHSWAETAVFDPLQAFRTFFEDTLPDQLTRPMVAFDTLQFFVRTRTELRRRTPVLGTYFPSLLKLVAWHGPAVVEDFLVLLPSLVTPDNYLEMVHVILDLPLAAALMERQVSGRKSDAELLQGRFRVLVNHVLRIEGGVSINFWATSGALDVLAEFFRLSRPTFRAEASADVALLLLDAYVDLLVERGTIDHAVELLSLLIERMEQLYPLASYVARYEERLCDKLVLLLQRWPQLLERLYDVFAEIVALTGKHHVPFFITLCWSVGEYGHECSDRVFNGYMECLELFVYERISFAKMGVEMPDSQTASINSRTPSRPLRAPSRQPATPAYLSASSSLPSSPMPPNSVGNSASGSGSLRSFKRLALFSPTSSATGASASTTTQGSMAGGLVSSPSYGSLVGHSSSSAQNSLRSLVGWAATESSHGSLADGSLGLGGDPFARPLIMAIASMAKLAALRQEYVSRVALCISKVIGNAAIFPREVIGRATEYLNLLRSPSVASIILATPVPWPSFVEGLDATTPLSYFVSGILGSRSFASSSNPISHSNSLHDLTSLSPDS